MRYNKKNHHSKGEEKMGSRKNYDEEYKAQAVKLANEKGGRKAAEELGISSKTLYGWMSKETNGRVTTAAAKRNGEIDQSLAEENIQLRKQLREQEKEIRRLNELNEFLGEASAFFAASRLKSGKTNE